MSPLYRRLWSYCWTILTPTASGPGGFEKVKVSEAWLFALATNRTAKKRC